MDDIGKKAEKRIREWLNRPEEGYCFDRIPDQLSGLYGSKNICDFTLFKMPYMYYIESKASWSDNVPFKMVTDYQREQMLLKSQIHGVYGIVAVLFASYQRMFLFDIRDWVDELNDESKQSSINIKKIDKWTIPYVEVATIPSRKELLEYTGEIDDYICQLITRRKGE